MAKICGYVCIMCPENMCLRSGIDIKMLYKKACLIYIVAKYGTIWVSAHVICKSTEESKIHESVLYWMNEWVKCLETGGIKESPFGNQDS